MSRPADPAVEARAAAAAAAIVRPGWTIGDVAEAASLGNDAAIVWSRWVLRHTDPRWPLLERVLEQRDPALLEELYDEWMAELYDELGDGEPEAGLAP